MDLFVVSGANSWLAQDSSMASRMEPLDQYEGNFRFFYFFFWNFQIIIEELHARNHTIHVMQSSAYTDFLTSDFKKVTFIPFESNYKCKYLKCKSSCTLIYWTVPIKIAFYCHPVREASHRSLIFRDRLVVEFSQGHRKTKTTHDGVELIMNAGLHGGWLLTVLATFSSNMPLG